MANETPTVAGGNGKHGAFLLTPRVSGETASWNVLSYTSLDTLTAGAPAAAAAAGVAAVVDRRSSCWAAAAAVAAGLRGGEGGRGDARRAFDSDTSWERSRCKADMDMCRAMRCGHRRHTHTRAIASAVMPGNTLNEARRTRGEGGGGREGCGVEEWQWSRAIHKQ